MSDVLIARIRACLADYDVQPTAVLDLDELAAEILEVALPTYVAADWRCSACRLTASSTTPSDSDCDPPGTHGYWCGL